MNFFAKKDKIVKLLKKEHFIYEVYLRDISDHILDFFKVEYKIEGNLLLIEKFFSINAYEVYFREHLPIGCYEDFKKRSEELCKYGIKILIVVDKVQTVTRGAFNQTCFLSVDEFLAGIKKAHQITKLIADSAERSCINNFL